MSAGTVLASEAQELRCPATGARIRQVTRARCHSHHPFYYLPAYDDAQRHLVMVSERSGRPEIWIEQRSDGALVQLTDCAELNEWSVHPSHDGRYVYYTAGGSGCRVRVADQRAEVLVDFSAAATRGAGQVGAGMGTTTLSRDDRYWAVPLRLGARSQLAVVDCSSGDWCGICERDTIAHPEFHPDDATLLRYAGSYRERIWVIDRDGDNERLVYRRDAAARQWIVHEVWRPGSREILTVDWPHGMLGIDVDSGTTRQVCSFNAWHAAISRDGAQMVADTTFPDRGLQLFDPRDGVGDPRQLCLSEASNVGEHWGLGHCPYDDGVVDVYAPQHTHPHPCFSPDGRRVVFTSDAGGYAQVYEVELGHSAER